MRFVGVDVSKNSLQCAAHDGAFEFTTVNNAAGVREVLRILRTFGSSFRVVVEPTARYHVRLVEGLHAASGIEVMVANPRQTHNFMKAAAQRGKSDPVDARMLAKFAARMEFVPWNPPSKEVQHLRMLVGRRSQLVQMRTQEKNRRAEWLALGLQHEALQSIEAVIKVLNAEIKKLEFQILLYIRATKELQAWRSRLLSIPGIGEILAMILTAELAHLPLDMTGKQLVAHAGLDPVRWQSGRTEIRGRISRHGNKRLRTAMFMAAWNAAKYSKHVRAYRDRLVARGKPTGVANIAAARRLLHAIVAMRDRKAKWDGARFHQIVEQQENEVA